MAVGKHMQIFFAHNASCYWWHRRGEVYVQSMALLQASSRLVALFLAFFQAHYIAWLCFKHLPAPRPWDSLWPYCKPLIGWAWAASPANTFQKNFLTALCFWFHGCKNELLLPCCLPKILVCKSKKFWGLGTCTFDLNGMPSEIWAPAGTSSPLQHDLAAKHNVASSPEWPAELHQLHPSSWKSLLVPRGHRRWPSDEGTLPHGFPSSL